MPGSGTTVAKLLEHGADINTPDKIGNSALINAASSGQTDVMKLLLDHGAKVGIKGILGTALAASYDLERADLLISYGATVDDWVPALIGQDARLDSEQKALFRAVTMDNVRGMATIPNSVSKEFPGGLTPLFLAIKLARTNVTDWLLEHGAVANERDARGMTPLHWAVIADTREPQKIALIDSLLKHGASIDVTEVCYGMTPLHFAAALFYKDIIDFLLRNKADPARRTKQGYTPMRLAQRSWAGRGDTKQKAVAIERLRRAVSTSPVQP
jgi:ankyrin repeat protein